MTPYNFHRFYDPNTERYVTEDPIGLDGGINLFLYVNANPIQFIDPEGLFVPRRHNLITFAAAEKECPKLKNTLPQKTALADFVENTQKPFNAYQHSMTNGVNGQTKVEARKQRDKWVGESLSECNEDSFARALHAIQDEYSESHDFNPWIGKFSSPAEFIWHMWKDSYGALGTPSRNAEFASIVLIKKWKKQCPCICKEKKELFWVSMP